METALQKNKQVFRVLYLANFLFSFGIALPAYTTSSFLNQFIPDKFVGILYANASILTIAVLTQMPRILRLFSNFRVAVTLIAAQIAFLITLATTTNSAMVVSSFILYWVTITLLVFSLDTFLESFSSDNATGEIRGKFSSISNLAWILAPMSAGILLTDSDYWKVYTVAAATLLLVLFVIVKHFNNFKDPLYDNVRFFDTLKVLATRKNVQKIFFANILLYFFYSWMIIYIPIYLHRNFAFSMEELGSMFTIMLVPFFLIQFPAGKIADAKLGEKEMLIAGFTIMSITTALFSFIDSTNFFVWATALFATRIGASLVEIMTDIYFFKKIDGTDIHLLSIYRSNRSLAYTIAPLVASALLFFVDFYYLFAVLGIILIAGIIISATIKDTK